MPQPLPARGRGLTLHGDDAVRPQRLVVGGGSQIPWTPVLVIGGGVVGFFLLKKAFPNLFGLLSTLGDVLNQLAGGANQAIKNIEDIPKATQHAIDQVTSGATHLGTQIVQTTQDIADAVASTPKQVSTVTEQTTMGAVQDTTAAAGDTLRDVVTSASVAAGQIAAPVSSAGATLRPAATVIAGVGDEVVEGIKQVITLVPTPVPFTPPISTNMPTLSQTLATLSGSSAIAFAKDFGLPAPILDAAGRVLSDPAGNAYNAATYAVAAAAAAASAVGSVVGNLGHALGL